MMELSKLEREFKKQQAALQECSACKRRHCPIEELYVCFDCEKV